MITTGTKLLIGSAVAAAVFALVYGITQGGALGTIGLISAAAGLGLLAGINTWLRDSNVSAMDHDAFARSAAARASARPSLWPLLAAIGATTMTLGLATYRPIFVLGLVAVLASALEWIAQGWAERASADPRYNSRARDWLIDPLELPIAGAAGAGIVVFAFSRVMLGLPSKAATVVAFAIVAALVLGIGAVVGLNRRASRAALTGTLGLAAVALVAGGAIAGLNGERDTHAHHTLADLAEDDECGADETEADEHASQSVAAKSNITAEVIFDGERLSSDLPGDDGNGAVLTVPRSTVSNVMFRNESDHAARLVVEMHPRRDADGDPLGPERICTALAEEDGGVQFLTLRFDLPSRAVEGGYQLVVPGSNASLEVSVP